ncbi:uncharacterized protein LOC135686821 [Rhopilema esculentum]|uniref:uncharacterized protein LOC135686821 n=1 Tax=Rhopilema esculentum TaxID=499914 RepID=UPI0031DB1696
MGGDSVHESERNHVPYTSVRKLFYDFSDDIDQPKKAPRNRKSEGRQRRFSANLFSNSKNVNDANDPQARSRRASEGMFMRPMTKSIHFHGSYSDFYCEHSNNLASLRWLSRSENKLNGQTAAILRRFQSLDPVKFKSIDLSLKSLEDISQQEDTNSCYKCPIEEEEEESFIEREWHEKHHDTGQEDEYITYENRANYSSTTSICWISATDSLIHDLPWTKRVRESKKAKFKRKQASAKRPSRFTDFVRTVNLERKNSVESSVDGDIQETNSFWETRTDSKALPLNLHRQSIYADGFTGICICDGYFGCP